ncbi:MAG: RND family transporter, partial [Robiginitalea sp.]
MVAKLTQGFWDKTARIILRNRILILLLIVAITLGLATQWQHMRFSTSEANLLPDEHPENIQYQEFLSQFGDEGNTIVIAVQDPAMGNPETFNQWNILSRQLEAFPEVDFVLSTENLQL